MGSGRGFRQRPALIWLRRWRFPIFVVFLAVFLGPDIIVDLGSSPSAWDWIGFGCLVILVIGLPLFIRDALRGDRPTPPRRDPSTIADDAVHHAISTTQDRVSAVRALREAHPGLGLKDAAVLVDAHRRS